MKLVIEGEGEETTIRLEAKDLFDVEMLNLLGKLPNISHNGSVLFPERPNIETLVFQPSNQRPLL